MKQTFALINNHLLMNPSFNTNISNSNLLQNDKSECISCQDDSAIPIKHLNIILDRIQKCEENPERLLDWEAAEKTLKH